MNEVDEHLKKAFAIQFENANAKIIARYLDGLLGNAYEICKNDYEHDAWKILYDWVFSDEISQKIFKKFPDFVYSDPDTTYYEDVEAFVSAFREYANEKHNEQTWSLLFCGLDKNENN